MWKRERIKNYKKNEKVRENKIFNFSSCVFGLRNKKLFYKFTIMSSLDKTKK